MNKKSYKIIIVILLIAIISVGGYFIFRNNKADKTNVKGWIDAYYEKLLDELKENEVYTDAKNISIQFVGAPDKDLPIMAVIYEKNNKKKINQYGVAKSGNGYRCWLMARGDSINYDYKLELLYDIEHKKYMWFVHSSGKDALGDNDWFLAVKYRGDSISYKFHPDELKENQTDENGNPILSKFDETFIKIDNNTESIEIRNIQNIDEKDLKEDLNLANKQYKKLDNIITDDIKTTTKNKLTEIENKKEQIKVANEEKAKKKAEEDAKRKAEAEAKKKAQEDAAKNGFKVGNYTMKYGTYKGSGGYEGFTEGATLVLRSNGTYTLTNQGRTSNGTFTYGNDGFIKFDDNSWAYKALGNNVFGNPEGAGYDEKFTFSGN